MGQIKGTPTYTTQQQAYVDKYGTGNASNRNTGTKPVMIAASTNLNTVVDATFATDTDLSSNAAADALKATIASLTELSSSLAARLDVVENP